MKPQRPIIDPQDASPPNPRGSGETSAPLLPSALEGRYGFLLRIAWRLLFEGIRPLPEQVREVQSLAERGTVVYVLKARSGLESLLCHYQCLRNGMPLPVLVHEADMGLFHSLSFFLRVRLRRIRKGSREDGKAAGDGVLRGLLSQRRSFILYLQDQEAFAKRFLKSGRDPFVELLMAQEESSRPVFMVPMMVIWDREQERTRPRIDELILGQKTNPSWIRVLFYCLRFYRRDSYITQGPPLEVKRFLEERREKGLRETAMELRQELLDRLQRERRLVTGPVARSRHEIMERVLLDERVQQAIQRRVKRKKKSERSVRKEAYRILKEITADFDPTFLRIWDRIMNWALRNLYEGLEVDEEGLRRVREVARSSNLVFVPCHRSHMDYMILAYILYHHYMFPPFIAAGLNLAFWPMGFIFRKSGAFFIRRDFRGSVLYPVLFNRYLRVLLEEGYPLEFFIEGGRSRSGKMILPKLGFLSLLIDGYRAGACRDIAFVPVAIAYERIMEEGAYLREVEGGEKPKESFWELIRSRHVFRRRYGKIYVNFNEPLSLKAFLERTLHKDNPSIRYTRHNLPYYLAYEIVHRINQVMVVVPTSLAAVAILCSTSPRGFGQREVDHLARLFYRILQEEGACFSSSLSRGESLSWILKESLDHLQRERWIQRVSSGEEEGDEDEDTFYSIGDRSRRRLDYYKNTILHYLLPYAFVAASLLANGVTPVPFHRLGEDIAFLRDLFRQEFVFLPEEDSEGRIRTTLERMSRLHLIRSTTEGYTVPPGRRPDLLAFARLIQSYFESYFVVGSSLRHLYKRRLSHRRFLWRVLFNGHRLYQTGKIRLPESLSNVNYINAIQYLVDQKIVLRHMDKTFREGIYYTLSLERRKIHWSRIKRFLRIYG